MAWGVKVLGRWVVNPMTETPRRWPTKEAAESWARLSYPVKREIAGAIQIFQPEGYYKIERHKR